MSYTIAAIDVHKKLLVVVIADVSQPELRFECRRFGTGAAELHNLTVWLCDHSVAETVMKSTAQYWKPVWLELEPHVRLHLAQAQSNRAPKGRKSDFGDAKRLLRRFVAGELFLSFVPGPEQRTWRTVTRGRLQLVRERVQLQGQLESLLEEGRIKLSSVISDLLGASGRRILRAMAEGETDPERLGALGDEPLKCGLEKLVDALRGAMNDIHTVAGRRICRSYSRQPSSVLQHGLRIRHFSTGGIGWILGMRMTSIPGRTCAGNRYWWSVTGKTNLTAPSWKRSG